MTEINKFIPVDDDVPPSDIEVVEPLLRGLHGRKWRLEEPISYVPKNKKYFGKIVVPVGFVTDLLSAPRCTWGFLPPHDDYKVSAIIHDWLYAGNKTPKWYADEIFKECLKIQKIGAFKRWLLFQSVKFFGFLAYYRNRKRSPMGEDRDA